MILCTTHCDALDFLWRTTIIEISATVIKIITINEGRTIAAITPSLIFDGSEVDSVAHVGHIVDIDTTISTEDWSVTVAFPFMFAKVNRRIVSLQVFKLSHVAAAEIL